MYIYMCVCVSPTLAPGRVGHERHIVAHLQPSVRAHVDLRPGVSVLGKNDPDTQLQHSYLTQCMNQIV